MGTEIHFVGPYRSDRPGIAPVKSSATLKGRGTKMAEKYGVENIEKVLVAVVSGVVIADKLANKEGIFSVFQFVPEFTALGSVNADQLRLEVSEFSAEERARVNVALKQKLVLHNKALEAKLEQGLDLSSVAVDLTQQVVKFINDAKSLLSA